MFFELEPKVEFTHPDGRHFVPGHRCGQLTIFEASELLYDFPDNFEATNDITKELAADIVNVEHYALAKKQKDGTNG